MQSISPDSQATPVAAKTVHAVAHLHALARAGERLRWPAAARAVRGSAGEAASTARRVAERPAALSVDLDRVAALVHEPVVVAAEQDQVVERSSRPPGPSGRRGGRRRSAGAHSRGTDSARRAPRARGGSRAGSSASCARPRAACRRVSTRATSESRRRAAGRSRARSPARRRSRRPGPGDARARRVGGQGLGVDMDDHLVALAARRSRPGRRAARARSESGQATRRWWGSRGAPGARVPEESGRRRFRGTARLDGGRRSRGTARSSSASSASASRRS